MRNSSSPSRINKTMCQINMNIKKVVGTPASLIFKLNTILKINEILVILTDSEKY